MRPDRPNRVSRRSRGAAGIAAAGAALALISACTTGTPDTTASSGDTTPSAPNSSGLSTAALPTDTALPTALPTDSAPATSATPTTTSPSTSPSASPPTTTRPATVGIHLSFYDWSAAQQVAEVGANVEDKVIRNGSCTLSMRRGSITRTASHKAIITPSATSCGVLTIPGSKLSAGAWTAVVTFTSPTATGSSGPVTITVTR